MLEAMFIMVAGFWGVGKMENEMENETERRDKRDREGDVEM
jgi:hypothetical protein